MIKITRKDGAQWLASIQGKQIFVFPNDGRVPSGQHITIESLFELFTIKIVTYGDLKEIMEAFSEEQLSANLTTELGWDNECYPCELRLAGSEHESLDENHPVFYVG